MRNLATNLGQEPVGDAEGGVDPAVGVHHVLGDVGVHDAVNGVSDVLPGGDKEAGCDEDDGGGLGQHHQHREY